MLARAAKRRRTSQPEPDYYQILGLRRDAKHQDIIRAYHREAKQTHPDRPGGSKEAFQTLAHAYEVLADDAKRQAYNASIVERGSCDGAAATHDPKKPTCERHILAEHP